MKKLLTILMAALLCMPQARASQNDIEIPTTGSLPGLTLVNLINDANNTLATNFSGTTAPSVPLTWQLWLDTTNNLLKIYNGSTWLPIGRVSGSQFVPVSNGVLPLTVTTTGSSNAYVATYSPAPSAYVTGQLYPVITNFANTGAATINVNGLGAKTIKKQGTTDLDSGDLPSGVLVYLVYDGTNMQIVGNIPRAFISGSGATLTSPTITGGTIDNTIIGGSSQAAASVTTFTATGVATLSAGNAAAPALNFGDSGTGFYRIGTDAFSVTNAGGLKSSFLGAGQFSMIAGAGCEGGDW